MTTNAPTTLRRKLIRVAGITAAILGGMSLAGLVITGATINWGPFAFLHSWEGEVAAIEQRYDPEARGGEIIFYGASNFAQWTQLDDDLSAYLVQNHAFGGSTDADLVQYADRLLVPYDPAIVVFQTGSNDYVGMTGDDEQKAQQVLERKRQMFADLHALMPDTQFVVMSGLLMPGRAQYTPLVQQVNRGLVELSQRTPYLTVVDAEALTWDGSEYDTSLFVGDGIHLTHEARLRWAEEYIVPTLDDVIERLGLEGVRRQPPA